MRRLLYWFAFGLCSATMGLAQSATSVSGTVSDPSSAVIVDATVTLFNLATAASRQDRTDQQGRYQFNQVAPGNYRITAEANGFGKVVVNNVQLLVNTPAQVPLAFKKVGATETEVTVEGAGAGQVDTSDASLGEAFAPLPIVQLPVEGHDVTSLLALQPGVTFIQSPNPGALNDPRSGSVNGGKSDQANVLLDGIDANDQLNRTSFTSVLMMTPDSVQEFRTITSNPGADLGFSSGAQVTILSKSGTNAFHGVMYEYNRNTALESNLFLNKQTTPVTPRPALIRNVFGGTFGGPIRKNRLFIFGSYEGRRDRSALTQNRIVPTALFKQGIFTYQAQSGGAATLTPQQIQALDPTGIGEDPAAVADLQKYPDPNAVGGDTLNTEGYTFNAPTPLSYNTYFGRMDWNIDQGGKHTMFWRGNDQEDIYDNGAPQFPGQPPSSVYDNFSKGFAFGYNWVATTHLVNAVRVGFTRESSGVTGTQTAAAVTFNHITPLYAEGSASSTQAGGTAKANQEPVWDIRDDVIWTKGNHTMGFGGEIFILRNHYESNASSFSDGLTNGLWLEDDGGVLIPPYALKTTNYERQIANIMGLDADLTRKINYDLSGNTLPDGQTIKRIFGQEHYDLYLQDSWRIRSNFTLTGGVRYTMDPAVHETQGYNVSATAPMGSWFANRAKFAAEGQPDSALPLVSYDLSSHDGIPFYFRKNDFQPRVSFAYSPRGKSAFMHAFTGGADKMSIRGGIGVFYDAFGQALAESFSTAAGFSTSVSDPPNQPLQDVPRYTGFYDLPTSSPLFPATIPGGFPQTPAVGGGLQDSTADSNIRAAYTMVQNFTISRQLSPSFMVQVSYVGRESRHSLLGQDMGAPTDLVDPASGMDYFKAARILSQEAQANVNNPNYVSPTVQYWEDLWPGAASSGVTATQAVYQQFAANLDDWTSALLPLDTSCSPSCSKFGPYAMWSPQFDGLSALRSIGRGSYNSFQAMVTKAFSHGYEFNINYTFSHCIDLGSSPEIAGSGSSADQIDNSWNPEASRAVCDYDLRHQFQVNGVWQLPFGRGRMFGGNARGLANGLIGGWQLTSITRLTSGFPGSVNDNVGYPTLWDNQGWATQIGPLPKKGPKGQMFSNPAAAYAAFEATYAGDSGTRNDLRGDGLFTIDGGLDKRWQLFSLHDDPNTLQFRIEGFNLTNTARFDISTSSASLDYGIPATFGKYEGPNQLIDPRVFQAVLRYEF